MEKLNGKTRSIETMKPMIWPDFSWAHVHYNWWTKEAKTSWLVDRDIVFHEPLHNLSQPGLLFHLHPGQLAFLRLHAQRHASSWARKRWGSTTSHVRNACTLRSRCQFWPWEWHLSGMHCLDLDWGLHPVHCRTSWTYGHHQFAWRGLGVSWSWCRAEPWQVGFRSNRSLHPIEPKVHWNWHMWWGHPTGHREIPTSKLQSDQQLSLLRRGLPFGNEISIFSILGMHLAIAGGDDLDLWTFSLSLAESCVFAVNCSCYWSSREHLCLLEVGPTKVVSQFHSQNSSKIPLWDSHKQYLIRSWRSVNKKSWSCNQECPSFTDL